MEKGVCAVITKPGESEIGGISLYQFRLQKYVELLSLHHLFNPSPHTPSPCEEHQEMDRHVQLLHCTPETNMLTSGNLNKNFFKKVCSKFRVMACYYYFNVVW